MKENVKAVGEPGGIRTHDQGIKSPRWLASQEQSLRAFSALAPCLDVSPSSRALLHSLLHGAIAQASREAPEPEEPAE